MRHVGHLPRINEWKVEGSHVQTNTGKLRVMTMMMMIVSVHFTALVIDFCCAECSCKVFMDVASGILIFRAVNAV